MSRQFAIDTCRDVKLKKLQLKLYEWRLLNIYEKIITKIVGVTKNGILYNFKDRVQMHRNFPATKCSQF